jgi:hypothetical protein
MVNRFWQLQLFADGAAGDGGAGGEGSAPAATGVESADAGHQRLRELGVPENRIRKNRSYQVKTPAAQPAAAAPATEPAQQDDAAKTEEKPKTEEAKPQTRMSWDEVKKDPEYSAEINKIVRSRLKDADAAQTAMTALMPWLKTVAKEHGLDPENIDYEALVKSANGEYDSKALELGVPKEIAMQLDQQNRTLEQQKFQDHIRKLEQQGESLKGTFPNFDLRTEMQNPTFSRLVGPGVGMSVEDAYYAVHRREIQAASMQVAAQKTAQQISNAIQSGSRRPDESGAAAQAPSVTTFDYKKMNRAEREALKKSIYQAAARGEKIYPGQ